MDIVKLGAYLFFVAAVASAALSATNSATKKRIEENRARRVLESYNIVMPDAHRFEDCVLKPETGARRAKRVLDEDGKLRGYVAELEPRGYAGRISVVVGLTFKSDAGAPPVLHISGVSIAGHNETPGLGEKITKSPFLDQFKCKSAEKVRLKLDDPSSGTIDAITAATVSSRAVTDAIRKLMDNFGEIEKK